MFLLVTEDDISFGIGDIFPMGTGMAMCEDTRLVSAAACDSLTRMSAAQLFTTGQKLYP